MRLVNAEQFINLEIEENRAVELVIESPNVMTDFISDLVELSNGGDGLTVLSEGDKELDFEKTAELVINPFAVDFNDRKIVAKLYSDLLSENEMYELEAAGINAAILSFLGKISSESSYDMISYDLTLDQSKLLKMYNVRIDPEYQSLTEKVAEYIKLLSRLMKKRLLILVNISAFLSADEVNALIKMGCYQKIKMLLIESDEKAYNDTKVYIIDKDKCFIEE